MDTETVAITNLGLLALYLLQHGPIPTARVSGAPGRWQAWGVVRYEIRLTADGRVTNAACGTADRQYRTRARAGAACATLCDGEGRLWVQSAGPVSEEDAARIVFLLRGGVA